MPEKPPMKRRGAFVYKKGEIKYLTPEEAKKLEPKNAKEKKADLPKEKK